MFRLILIEVFRQYSLEGYELERNKYGLFLYTSTSFILFLINRAKNIRRTKSRLSMRLMRSIINVI